MIKARDVVNVESGAIAKGLRQRVVVSKDRRGGRGLCRLYQGASEGGYDVSDAIDVKTVLKTHAMPYWSGRAALLTIRGLPTVHVRERYGEAIKTVALEIQSKGSGN